jgi:hypothetical protein
MERYPAVRPVLKTVVFAMDDEYMAGGSGFTTAPRLR